MHLHPVTDQSWLLNQDSITKTHTTNISPSSNKIWSVGIENDLQACNNSWPWCQCEWSIYLKTAYFHKNPSVVTFNNEETYKIPSADKPSEYQCVNGVYTLKLLVFTRIQTLSPSTMKTHTKLIPQASEWFRISMHEWSICFNHMNPSIVTYNNEGTYKTLPDQKALG